MLVNFKNMLIVRISSVIPFDINRLSEYAIAKGAKTDNSLVSYKQTKPQECIPTQIVSRISSYMCDKLKFPLSISFFN